MEILAKLGVDYKLLLAQIVNFLVLLLILHRFAYKPILKVLEDRREKIDQGLKDSQAAAEKLREAEESGKAVLAEAKYHAERLLERSEEAARKQSEEMLVTARLNAERMISDTERKIGEEKEKMLREAKQELAGLVIAASEKIVGEKIDAEKDKNLIDNALRSL